MSPALPLTPVPLHVSFSLARLALSPHMSICNPGRETPFGNRTQVAVQSPQGRSGVFLLAIARHFFPPMSSGLIAIDTPISNSRHTGHTCQIMAKIICSSAHIADLNGAQQKLPRNCIVNNATTISRTPGPHRRQRSKYFAASTYKKNIFPFLHDALKFLFENVKPSPDICKVLATRENKFS